MASIRINDQQVEVEAGRALVEAIKEAGVEISNLCYIDGLPPYAGCRTCAVEIEGVPGLPLSCTSTVQDGMVVRTDTPAATAMRQEVLAMILANHSDRCLTCHRVEHCRTGEICLRDNVVSHRCVTCSKNYRCELQTACDAADIGRASVEPYLDEARSYYAWEQPQPDRANPYFEFDPQMCIICTRCVRACDDLRHTTAITLAGRGFTTRIAFGAGGAIEDSNCDFCGACVDVCPTATLMETPNKWVARPNRWVTTTCTECSMGCTIQMGVKDGRGVIVRPGNGNDVSRNQICVRGRFGYDQIRDKHRLASGRLGRGQDALNTPNDTVIADVTERLAAVIQQHGAGSIGVLGSGQATNEELFLLRRLADVIGTPHVDSSAGAVMGGVANTLRSAFGSEHLSSRLTDIESADLIVAIADDLSASNNVLGVRIKDAVANNGATLISISARANPLDDFTPDGDLALHPSDGDLAAVAQSIAAELLKNADVRGSLTDLDGLAELQGSQADGAAAAAAALEARRGGQVAVVVAPSRHSAPQATAQVAAAANLSVALAGAEAAPAALHILPPEANAIGVRDFGIVPQTAAAPAEQADGDGSDDEIEAADAAPPQPGGMGVVEMLAAARAGVLKALVVHRDNPILLLPDQGATRAALQALDLLVVIDEVATETVEAATHVIADVSTFAKDGSITNADRQILRLLPAQSPHGAAQPALASLEAVTQTLAAALGVDAPSSLDSVAAVMDAIATADPRYADLAGGALLRQSRQPSNGAVTTALLPVEPAPTAGQGLVLLSGRDLYTDRISAALDLEDADRIGRGQRLEIHPRDAAQRNISDGDQVTVRRDGTSLGVEAQISDGVPEGAVWLPLLLQRGATQALLRGEQAAPRVEVSGG